MFRKGRVASSSGILLAGLLTLGADARAQDEPKMLNPYAGDSRAARRGRSLFMSLGCSGCHGLMGGGGMGKPILDDTWIFGSDDETLYRLIKGRIPEQTMPRAYVGVPEQKVWQMIAYVRSLYKGDPALVNWPSKPPEGALEALNERIKAAAGFKLPKGLHDMEIPVPPENPITDGKIELGEQLFFDKRLSKNKDMSCETCHVPEKGWTDGQAFSKRYDGSVNELHTPTLFGTGFLYELFWDGRAANIEEAVLEVIKTQMGADPEAVAKELAAIPGYKSAFEAHMGGPPSADGIAKALASFVRTLHAADTPYDNLPPGSHESPIAQGFQVFSEVAHCTLCHLPPLFSDTVFHNIGISVDYRPDDKGYGQVLTERAQAAGEPVPERAEAMMGAFKTPSLRGLLMSGPYFHDGRAKTYEEAADFMMKGGKANPHLDKKLKVYPITPEQRDLLLAFVRSLTPESKPYSRPQLP